MLFVILGLMGVGFLFWGYIISGVVGLILVCVGIMFSFWCPWATTWKEESSEEIFAMDCFTNQSLPVYVVEGNGFWVYKTSKTVEFEKPYNKLEIKKSGKKEVEIIEGTREKYTLAKYTTASDNLISFDLNHQEKYVFYVPEGSVIG